MLVDLHAKTSLSPGVSVSADRVLQRAAEIGLDAVAFCDTLATAHATELIAKAEAAGITAFVGVEIPTDKGILVGFTPNIDSFYLNEEWRQLTEFATPPANEVIQMFAEQGGAVIASRPYDLTIPYNMGDLIFTLDNIQGVEVFNTRCGQIQCDFALEAAKFMGVSTCGGTDPKEGDKSYGRYATFFEESATDQASFVEVLRSSEFWAVQFGDSPKAQKSNRESNRRDSGKRGSGRRSGKRGGGGRGRGKGRGGRGKRN